MIARAAAVAGWLAAGHAAVGCLYWLFLQVPESNAWMLAASFVLVLTSLWLTGVIEMTALLALAEDGPMRGALGTALGRAWMIVFPLGLFVAMWWATGEAAAWHARYSGQIDAEIIARTGWTRPFRSGCAPATTARKRSSGRSGCRARSVSRAARSRSCCRGQGSGGGR